MPRLGLKKLRETRCRMVDGRWRPDAFDTLAAALGIVTRQECRRLNRAIARGNQCKPQGPAGETMSGMPDGSYPNHEGNYRGKRMPTAMATVRPTAKATVPRMARRMSLLDPLAVMAAVATAASFQSRRRVRT